MNKSIPLILAAVLEGCDSINTYVRPEKGDFPYSHVPSEGDFLFTDINPNSETYRQSISIEEKLEEGPVLLHFFEPWCAPCMDELPLLEQLDQDGHITILGFSEDYYSYPDSQKEKNQTLYEHWTPIEQRITFPFFDSRDQYEQAKSVVLAFAPYVVNNDPLEENNEPLIRDSPTNILLYSPDATLNTDVCVFVGTRNYHYFSAIVKNKALCNE